MEILPAIDLLNAEVVRLRQGDYAQGTIYSSDPGEVADRIAASGARWIHVVDLDAARSGKPTNRASILAVRKVACAHGMKVELGGGARDEATILAMLRELADRVVVGSAAMKDFPWFESLLKDPEMAPRLALGLDARDGMLAAQGWTEQTSIPAVELAERVCGSRLGAIIYTDISRDGMLSGVNAELTERLVKSTDVPVIASGGVGSLEDVARCQEMGCAGVIIGKAWYAGRIDLAEAVAQSLG
jgi:phosphoribosylformimino-5-aminoimidazole carboxamide ribotide isomerase